MSRIVKQLDAEAVKVKRAKLDEMLSECSPMQNALFNKIYGGRPRHPSASARTGRRGY